MADIPLISLVSGTIKIGTSPDVDGVVIHAKVTDGSEIVIAIPVVDAPDTGDYLRRWGEEILKRQRDAVTRHARNIASHSIPQMRERGSKLDG